MALSVEAIGLAVRHARLSLGLSQEALAFAAGLDRTYVSGLERGVRNARATTLAQVAEALGVKLSRVIAMAERIDAGALEVDRPVPRPPRRPRKGTRPSDRSR